MLLIPFPKKKTWVAGTTDAGRFDCLSIRRVGNSIEIEEFLSCAGASDLPPDVSSLVIHSERILISNESFPPVKDEILRLQVEERIRPLGPWGEDTPLHHCISLVTKGNTLATYAVISLPQGDIEKPIKKAQKSGKRIRKCIPHIASISALAGRLTTEPVISCFLSRGYLEILVSEKGIPYYSQISPLEEQHALDFDIVAQAIFNVRQIFNSKFRKNVKKLLFFSKEDIQVPEKIGDEEVWRPSLDGFITKGDRGLFWKYPELIGAPFVSDDFDCLPKDLKTAHLLQDLNKKAACTAVAAAFALGCSGLLLKSRQEAALSRFNALYSATMAKKEEVMARMPQAEEVQKVTQILSVYKEMLQEEPIDSLLYSIAERIPEKVVISELKAQRAEPVQNADEPEIPSPERLMESERPEKPEGLKGALPFYKEPLTVYLELATRGSFQEVKTRLEKAAKLLGQGFEVRDAAMSYVENTSKGLLKCNLYKRGE